MTTATRTVDIETPMRRSAAAYSDFVIGIRTFNATVIRGALQSRYAAESARFEAEKGRAPKTLEDARQLLDSTEEARWWRRLARTTQEMNWRAAFESLDGRREEFLRSLEAISTAGPGRLLLDPAMEYPAYITDNEIHIQPGSTYAFPESGYVYSRGVLAYHSGSHDPMARRQQQVEAAPVPADGRVERVLDLACSVGFCTQPWKVRFPEAEVYGIDISAPMLTWAHKRAVEAGLDITYAQMPAEALKFPDGHFDVVYANILFHELPVEVTAQVLEEANRVLRPGGVFSTCDFRSSRYWTAWDAWIRDFDSNDNGEPFAWDYCHADMQQLMEAAGFVDVTEGTYEIFTTWTGTKAG